MPTSVSLNTQDPVLAKRNTKSTIRRQLGKSSPLFAAMYGGSAERSISGMSPMVSVESFEVLQRDIQIAPGITPAHIAPSSSDTTALGTTKATSVMALYGGLTCAYGQAPMSLDEEIHGGKGAKHPRKNIDFDNIAYDMTRLMITGFLSAGSGASPDGALKWISETATKWGLNTTTAGNYYFRGHEKSGIALADYDEDDIREDIRLCATGEIEEGGVTYNANGDPKLGICDSKTFSKLQAMVSDRQVINMPAGTTEAERYCQIGGYFRKGITIDQVTFFPDLMMDELKETNSSGGELFIINPDDWELIFLKGFAFDWITDPDKDFGKTPGGYEVRKLVDVVWGEVMVNIALYNWFCHFPRGQLYRTLS